MLWVEFIWGNSCDENWAILSLITGLQSITDSCRNCRRITSATRTRQSDELPIGTEELLSPQYNYYQLSLLRTHSALKFSPSLSLAGQNCWIRAQMDRQLSYWAAAVHMTIILATTTHWRKKLRLSWPLRCCMACWWNQSTPRGKKTKKWREAKINFYLTGRFATGMFWSARSGRKNPIGR